MKRSAGILVYRKNKEVEVLLTHPGGPYWKDATSHCYSIPKGELEGNESSKKAAIREFKEETNLDAKIDELDYLASKKISNKKLAIIFVINKDYDLSNCKSNTFTKDFNGIIQEFPEVDGYKWFKLDEAKEMIFNSQVYFIDRFKEYLNDK